MIPVKPAPEPSTFNKKVREPGRDFLKNLGITKQGDVADNIPWDKARFWAKCSKELDSAYNIQCNGIGPGYIATPQTAPLREIQPDGSRHPFDQFIVAKTPAGRWGEAEDLGGPAVFLASEASDFVNGLILYVDGGILAYIGKQPQ